MMATFLIPFLHILVAALTLVLSRAKVYLHGFLIAFCSPFIKMQKPKKILKLHQICDSMVQTRIFYFKPFGNDNQNNTTPSIKKC